MCKITKKIGENAKTDKKADRKDKFCWRKKGFILFQTVLGNDT